VTKGQEQVQDEPGGARNGGSFAGEGVAA